MTIVVATHPSHERQYVGEMEYEFEDPGDAGFIVRDIEANLMLDGRLRHPGLYFNHIGDEEGNCGCTVEELL